MPTSVEKLSTSQPSPLSPTHWPAEAFRWPRSLGVFVVLATSVVVGLVIDSLVAVRMGVTRSDLLTQHLRWGILAGQVASYVLPLIALFAFLPWLARRSLGQLGVRGFDQRTLVAGALGAAAMYAVTLLVANVQVALTHAKPQEAATALFAGNHDRALALAFAALAVVVAPFVEELVFRGFLFNAVLRYAPVWAAALISGVVFGLFHLSPSAFLPLACSGIVLAYVYYLSGSLTASMLTHALFNAINIALLAVGKGT